MCERARGRDVWDPEADFSLTKVKDSSQRPRPPNATRAQALNSLALLCKVEKKNQVAKIPLQSLSFLRVSAPYCDLWGKSNATHGNLFGQSESSSTCWSTIFATSKAWTWLQIQVPSRGQPSHLPAGSNRNNNLMVTDETIFQCDLIEWNLSPIFTTWKVLAKKYFPSSFKNFLL